MNAEQRVNQGLLTPTPVLFAHQTAVLRCTLKVQRVCVAWTDPRVWCICPWTCHLLPRIAESNFQIFFLLRCPMYGSISPLRNSLQFSFCSALYHHPPGNSICFLFLRNGAFWRPLWSSQDPIPHCIPILWILSFFLWLSLANYMFLNDMNRYFTFWLTINFATPCIFYLKLPALWGALGGRDKCSNECCIVQLHWHPIPPPAPRAPFRNVDK